MQLTTHVHLVPRLRMSGAIPPSNAFMACETRAVENQIFLPNADKFKCTRINPESISYVNVLCTERYAFKRWEMIRKPPLSRSRP